MLSAAQANYGVVDLDKVVQSSSYLKQQNASLQSSLQPKNKQLDQLQKDLLTIQSKGQKAKSQAEHDQYLKEYEAKSKELSNLHQSIQSTVQSTMRNVNEVFVGRVKKIAEQMRTENNLEVILDKNSTLAYDAKYDLTDKMIQRVNAIK